MRFEFEKLELHGSSQMYIYFGYCILTNIDHVKYTYYVLYSGWNRGIEGGLNQTNIL